MKPEPAWDMIALLERLPVSVAASALSDQLAREKRRARAELEELKPWPELPPPSVVAYRRGANRVRLRRLLDFIQRGDRVLDVGIGYGYVTGVLVRTGKLDSYCGIDLAQRFVTSARAGLEANGLPVSHVALEVRDLYDVTPEWAAMARPTLALCLEVLEHVPDAESAVRTLAQAIPPECSLLFTVPILRRLEGVWGHTSVFDVARLRRLCAQAGLTVHHVEPIHNAWSLVLASRATGSPSRLASALEAVPSVTAPTRNGHCFTDVLLSDTARLERVDDAGGDVHLTPANRGVACTVTAGSGASATGGVVVPARAPAVVRLHFSVGPPEAVERMTLTGLDAGGAAVAKWEWSATDRAPVTATKQTLVLRAEDGGPLKPRGRLELGGVRRLELSVEARAGASAKLTLHRMAFVSSPE